MKSLILVLTIGLFAGACGPSDAKSGSARDGSAAAATSSRAPTLTGAGATFPYPIYSKWFADYAAKTGVEINYQPIGSGGGIRQLSEETVDFGASDAPMTDDEMAKAKGGPIQHIPTVLGAVCITYNVAEIMSPLKLSGDVIVDIFLGKITKWNDVRIAALNPGVSLPSRTLVVVHRADASGTTYILSDYLSAISSTWNASPGRGKELSWPTGLGAKGNDGVTGQVKQTPGAIGYVELAYARQNKLPVALVRNAAGQFVAPSMGAVTAAAASVVSKLPATSDFRISIVNSSGAEAYPISSFTWMLVYKTMPNADKGKKLLDFLHWALHEGESAASSLDYAPLPAVLVGRLDSTLATMKPGVTP